MTTHNGVDSQGLKIGKTPEFHSSGSLTFEFFLVCTFTGRHTLSAPPATLLLLCVQYLTYIGFCKKESQNKTISI